MKYIRLTSIVIVMVLFFQLVPSTVQAAFSSEKKIGDCTFYSYIVNKAGKKITSIGPDTEFYVVVEWSPGIGKCDDFDSAQIGWYTPGVATMFYPQFCNEPSKIVGSKRVVKVKFNTVKDTVIRKYISPQNGISVCNEGEAYRSDFTKALQLNGAVGTSTSTGNGDNDPKQTDPNQPPIKDDGPKGKDNKDINTDVTFKCDPSPCNFDTPLGFFFNPLQDGITVPGLVVRLINILLMISGTVAVGFIIFGGLMMVTSGGNESRVTKGKQTVIYAVAGLVVSILSFSIVAIIQSIIN